MNSVRDSLNVQEQASADERTKVQRTCMNPGEHNVLGNAALQALLARRSVSPRRLEHPGPTTSELRLMLAAALRAPDHGGLRPWRLIEFGPEVRCALADVFEAEKLDRDPLASPEDCARAREHATKPPQLFAFVVSPKEGVVPAVEQWLSAGAALANLLNAAHMQGYGAIILSGDRVFSQLVRSALGVSPAEHLAGFVALGSMGRAPPTAHAVAADHLLSIWQPIGCISKQSFEGSIL